MTPFLSYNRNHFFFAGLLLVLSLLAGTTPCQAQDRSSLPDSVASDSLPAEPLVAPSDPSSVGTGNAASTGDTAAGSGNSDSTDAAGDDFIPDSVTFRQVSDKTLQRYRKDPDFAYANDPRYWIHEEERPSTSFDRLFRFFDSPVFKWLVYLIVGGLLLFALYKVIAGNKLYLFYKRSGQKSLAQTGDEIDLDRNDLEEKIREAVRNANHREAVRYLFLLALKTLDGQGLIEYDAKKTNQDYLGRLSRPAPGARDTTGTAKEFGFLVYAYEHVWYGGLSLGERQFQTLYDRFQQFYRTF